MDLNNVCLTCLSCENLYPLHTTECLCKDEVMLFCYDALKSVCKQYISIEEHFPQKICKKCIENLRIAYEFLKKCKESYLEMCKHLMEVNNQLTPQVKEEKFNFKAENIANECVKERNEDCVMDETFTDQHCTSEDEKIVKSTKDDMPNRRKKARSKSNTVRQSQIGEEIKVLYFCEKCQKKVKNLKLHDIRVHSERRTLQCERCSAIFIKPYSLSLHMRQHENNLPYVCTHPGCDKAFAIPSFLKQHATVHSGERQFVCQYCSHGARTKQQLAIHIRYHHTKEKNYVCNFCSKAFVSCQARYNHEKIHKNIKDYACQYCDKTFVSAGNLSAHTLTHTGVKNFTCRLCGTKFTRKDHRDKHERNIHGVANQHEGHPNKTVN